MSIPISIKKKVSQDWLSAYPELSPYKANKLFKIVGPFILGIELFTLPYQGKEYRPYFVGYSLWDNNEEECMLGPLFLQEIRNKKGRQFNIPFSDYDSKNAEAIECTKNQIKTSFDKIVLIKDLLQVINNLFSSSYSLPEKVSVYITNFYFALYIGDLNLINETLKEIINVSSDWGPNIFKFRYGTREQFIDKLQNDIINRESFLNLIKLNQGSNKFKKLKISDLEN
jgi:hypothetical protein